MPETPVSCGSGSDPELHGHLYEPAKAECCPAYKQRAKAVKTPAALREIWRASALLFLQNSRSDAFS